MGSQSAIVVQESFIKSSNNVSHDWSRSTTNATRLLFHLASSIASPSSIECKQNSSQTQPDSDSSHRENLQSSSSCLATVFQCLEEGAFHAISLELQLRIPSLRACPCLPHWCSFHLHVALYLPIDLSVDLQAQASSLLWPMEYLCVAPDGPIWHQQQLDSS